jgi:hypothetical protein
MSIDLVVKMLQALLPDYSLSQLVAMAEQRLRGKLTQQELSEFLALKAEAKRRSQS